MCIKRIIEPKVDKDYFKGKVIVLLGARQVGKSTFIRNLELCVIHDTLWLNGENDDVRLLFQHVNSERLKQLSSGHKVIVIDEAQKKTTHSLLLK